MQRRTAVILGLVLFLAGGAVLAYGEGNAATGAGTLLGVMGLGLTVWGALRRKP